VSVHHRHRPVDAGPTIGEQGGGVVPDEVVIRGKAAFAKRATGSLHAGPPAAPRTLRFVSPSVSVKVSVTADGVWRTVSGRVVPETLRVQLEREGAAGVPSDEVAPGCFGFVPIPRGLVRLRLHERDGCPSARTEWFLV